MARSLGTRYLLRCCIEFITLSVKIEKLDKGDVSIISPSKTVEFHVYVKYEDSVM